MNIKHYGKKEERGWQKHSQVEAVPKVMSATLNVVVSINSTTVMQTYWTAPCRLAHVETLASGFKSRFLTGSIFIMQMGL